MEQAIPLTTTTATAEAPAVPQAQAPAKKEFLNYIHNFRGVAIIFVVAAHILLNWAQDSYVRQFLRVFWENATILFMFIAGYLFQHLSKRFEYKSYLVKKWEGVILPYFIVSVPIIVYRMYTNDIPGYILGSHPDFLTWTAGKKLAYFIFTGAHMQQLWFIPMILVYYLLAPMFIYIDRHPKWYWILLVVIPISMSVPREPFNEIPRMFVHFFSVYLFGMFMSKYRTEYMEWVKKYWLPVTLLTIAVFTANLYFYKVANTPLNFAHKMLFCCIFIYWLWKLDKYIPAWIRVLAEISFGIYFVHYYFLLIIKMLYERTMHHAIPGNLLYWTLDYVLIMGASVLFIKVVKKVTGKYSRNLIGC